MHIPALAMPSAVACGGAHHGMRVLQADGAAAGDGLAGRHGADGPATKRTEPAGLPLLVLLLRICSILVD